MAQADTTTTHWAVLIGINFYVAEPCLRGSVCDVETVRQYLLEGPTAVDIAILTATTPPNPNSRRPKEDSDSWPTWTKVVEKLKRVIGKSKPGDFVYIHYSGHGTRRKDSSKYAHQSGNLALALFADNEHGISYFQGWDMASCLRQMVKKGLHVTVVLDCCYSGSVLRAGSIRGAEVRAIDYNPTIDNGSSPEFATGPFDLDDSLRNTNMSSDQWLVNPDGYTILSACAPHEEAHELELGSGERRGALSYFLMQALNALRKSDVELTNHSLYQHLRTRFHASWPQQTPMHYGNRNYSFFDQPLILPRMNYVPIFKKKDGRLCLNAGEVHGVHKGDEYIVYPFATSESIANQPNKKSVIVRVKGVQGLTADLSEIDMASARNQIQTGWKAKAITSLTPRKISVRVMESAYSQMNWESALERQGYFNLYTEDQDTEACIFNVTINEHRAYEILDGTLQRISSLPVIPLDSLGAHTGVMDILQHITAFKYFEGVENRTPSPSFDTSFAVLPFIEADEYGICTVQDGGSWHVTVENHGVKPLYLALFNFTPSWEIIDLLSGRHLGIVYPKDEDNDGKVEIPLDMVIPKVVQDRGEKQCEDIVKIFLTSKPTSFMSMSFPDISYAQHYERGCGPGGKVSEFLANLTRSFRGQDHEEWTTHNFIIRTIMY